MLVVPLAGFIALLAVSLVHAARIPTDVTLPRIQSRGTLHGASRYLREHERFHRKPNVIKLLKSDVWVAQGIDKLQETDHFDEEDINNCTYPKDIPWSIPLNPNNKNKPYVTPRPQVWHGLNMDAWLAALIRGCPAVAEAHCPDVGDGKQKCAFGRSLGKLLVGEDSAVVCDAIGCAWDPSDDSTRGPMPGPNTRPKLHLNMTESEVEIYRRWYGMQALLQLWKRYQVINRALLAGTLVDSVKISNIVDRFAVEATKMKIIDAKFLLGIAKSLTSFLPYSPEILAIIDTLELATDAHDPLEILGDLAPIVDSISAALHIDLSNIETMISIATTAARELYGDPSSEESPADKVYSAAEISIMLAEIFQEMQGSVAAQISAILKGHPLLEGGYLQAVTGGLFSTDDGVDDLAIVKTTRDFSAYLQEKLLGAILKSQNIFIYRRSYGSMMECNTFIVPKWVGQMCLEDGANVTGYMILSPHDFSVGYRWYLLQTTFFFDQRYPTLSTENLAILEGKPTLETIFKKSEECFQSTNNNFIQHPDVCTGMPANATSFNPALTLYPSELSNKGDIGRLKMSNRVCHWSLPVFDGGDPLYQQACINWATFTNRPRVGCSQIQRIPDPDWHIPTNAFWFTRILMRQSFKDGSGCYLRDDLDPKNVMGFQYGSEEYSVAHVRSKQASLLQCNYGIIKRTAVALRLTILSMYNSPITASTI